MSFSVKKTTKKTGEMKLGDHSFVSNVNFFSFTADKNAQQCASYFQSTEPLHIIGCNEHCNLWGSIERLRAFDTFNICIIHLE